MLNQNKNSILTKKNILKLTLGVSSIAEWATYFQMSQEDVGQFYIASMVTTMFISSQLLLKSFEIIFDVILTIIPPLLVMILIFVNNDVEIVLSGVFLMSPIVIYLLTKRSWSLLIASSIYLTSLFFLNDKLIQATIKLQDKDNRSLLLIRLGISISVVLLAYYQTQREQQKAHNEALHLKEQAEIANKQLQSFIQSTSHELRNPLNSLKGSIDLALTEENLPSNIKTHLNRAQTCTQLLLQLINNILDSGKAENGALEINPQPTNLRKICEQVWGIFCQIMIQKGLTGYLLIEKNLPKYINLDPIRTSQVLMNLLSNSIKFTAKGRIQIKIEWIKDESLQVADKIQEEIKQYFCNNYIEQKGAGALSDEDQEVPEESKINLIDLNRSIQKSFISYPNFEVLTNTNPICTSNIPYIDKDQKGLLRITVQDTGQGLKKENLKKLFTRFSQFSMDKGTRQMGTGLGLSITKEIINKSGGDIQVNSKESVGTVFVACIPSVYKNSYIHASEPCPKSMSIDLVKKQPRIIVVDDSPQHVDLLTSFITKFKGNLISKHYTGRKCFEYVQEQMESPTFEQKEQFFDLIISDLDMPEMDGFTMSKKIKELEEQKKIRNKCKIIIISGNDIKQSIQNELINTKIVVDFIKKPYTFTQLVQCIYKQISANNDV